MLVNCPYAREVPAVDYAVNCRHLTRAAGFLISPCIECCKACIQAGGPTRPVRDTPFLANQLKHFLIARLNGGDCPLRQAPNPVDVNDAFAKLAAITPNRAELGERLKTMFLKWLAIPEERGGHPSEIIAQKIEAIAAAHDLTNVLDDLER